MMRIYPKPGLRFRLKDEIYKILKVYPGSDIEAQSESFHDVKIFVRAELLKSLENGDLVFETTGKLCKTDGEDIFRQQYDNSQLGLEAHYIDKAMFRFKVIEPLLLMSRRTKNDVRKRAEEINGYIHTPDVLKQNLDCNYVSSVTVSTIYNWIKAYESSNGDNLSLIPGYYRSGGKNKLRFSSEIENKIYQIITDFYQTQRQLTVQDIFYMITNEMNETQTITGQVLKSPSRSTIYRIVQKIPEAELVIKRLGKTAAKKFKMVENGVKVEIPLERIEIDHTLIKNVFIDIGDQGPLRKAYLTAATDKSTKMMPGFCISFEPPSYSTVMQCLRHILMDKSYVNEKYPLIKHEWNAYGVPKTIVSDNGPEFHSKAYIDACFQLGCVAEYAPSRTPEWKGSIERFFDTFKNTFANTIPGNIKTNIKERKDYDPEKEACIPITVFLELVHIWVIDVYNQQLNRGAGGIPAALWDYKTQLYPPAWPSSTHELPILLGLIATRKISNKGIELDSLYYNSLQLNKLLCSFSRENNGFNERFTIKWDPLDISAVYVYDHLIDNKWIKVPAVDQEYTHQLTRWEHKNCREMARQTFGKVDIESLAASKQLIFNTMETWYADTHGKNRNKATRSKKMGSQAEIFPTPSLSMPEETGSGTISNLGFTPEVVALNDSLVVLNNNIPKTTRKKHRHSKPKSKAEIQSPNDIFEEANVEITFDFD